MSKANSIEEGTDAFSILKNKSFLSTRELSQEIDVINKSRWEKFLEVVWDGPKTDEERKYIRKLDIFLLTWGWYVAIGYPQKKNYIYAQVLTLCSYGYFVKLLDSNNFTNAYISGMREDVGITGDNYNYVQSIYMAGYVVGVVPSQIITLKVRPSIYFPCTELIWAVLTLCTSRVTTVEQLYAIRFLIGFFESPFYMGAISLLSDWYGEESLSKRACILYSASNVSSMFAGYLQAGIYNNLDGKGGRAGWQWLFIVCGCITIPLSLYGFIAIPDNPLRPSKLAFWLNDEDKKYAAKKYKQTRVAFSGFEFSEIKRMIFDWPFYVIIFCYTSYMIFTNAMSYFILFIQSLGRYSVAQENSIPTSAQAVALVFTLLLGWLADWKGRHLTLQIALTVNLVSCIFLLISPVEGCVWFGYIISGISWCYGPILLSWSQEFLRRSEMEAKFTVGVAQASAIANLIWATIVLWSTEKQYPYYRAAYIVCLILTVVQMPLTYGMNVLIKRKNMLDNVTKVYEEREKDVNS